MRFFTARQERFKTWWHAPATKRDRVISAILGIWAFLIIGVVIAFAIAPNHSLSLAALVYWALGSMACGATLGALFPKVIRCIALPFAFIGFGVSGNT